VKLRGVIATEITEIRDKFANPRRTAIVNDPGELGVEDLIDDEEVVIAMTQAGYIKSVSADAFRTQGRGGRGVQGAKLKDDDFVDQIIHTTTHAYLLLFSNKGRVFRMRGHEIPMKERTAKGTAVVNLLNLQPNERIQAIVTTKDFPDDKFLVFATANGTVKKTAFSEYDKSRREGWIAIKLREGDEVVRVVATSGNDELMIVTYRGMAIRFSETEVREVGRDSTGVRGIRLKDDDAAIALDVIRDDADLLLVTDTGFGKRVKVERFTRQGRSGQGVRAIRLTAARGFVAVAAFMASLIDDILLASSGGVLIRRRAGSLVAGSRRDGCARDEPR
jgi:DNA gyrase subunit A